MLIYRSVESVLTSRVKVDPDVYIMTNGHVNCSKDSNNPTTIQSTQQRSSAYTMKNSIVCDYAGSDVPLESVTDYVNPNHVNLIDECGCPTIDGCAEFADHHIITDASGVSLMNQSYVTHSSVDGNGYVTNGNMRIPPEGMEATCAIAPQ